MHQIDRQARKLVLKRKLTLEGLMMETSFSARIVSSGFGCICFPRDRKLPQKSVFLHFSSDLKFLSSSVILDLKLIKKMIYKGNEKYLFDSVQLGYVLNLPERWNIPLESMDWLSCVFELDLEENVLTPFILVNSETRTQAMCSNRQMNFLVDPRPNCLTLHQLDR